MPRRTFDWSVNGEYRANKRERWIFAHIEVSQFQPRYGNKARLLRLFVFIGDGNEEVVQTLCKKDVYDLDGEKGNSLLADYRDLRKSIQQLPWRTFHQRAGKRDWLFRADFPVAVLDLLTWANWLQPFGVDRDHFAKLVQLEWETAPT